MIIAMIGMIRWAVVPGTGLGTPPPLCLIFVGTAMTLGTIIVGINTFLNMFATNISRRVFVATVTGKCLIIILNMTGNTGGLMVAVEAEITIMIEGGRTPGLLLMTETAIPFHHQVHIIIRPGMTIFTSLPEVGLEQGMGKGAPGTKSGNTLVVTVTGHAIILNQGLMKGQVLLPAIGSRVPADVRHGMTCLTFPGRTAP